MTDNADHFIAYPPHTRLKHEILEAYLQAFSFKLLQSPARSRVWFLDGFAGAGCDQQQNQGSPTIACRVAAQVRTKLNSPPKRLGVICIESSREYFKHLENHLEPFRLQDPANLVLLPGAFADRYAEALARTGSEPVFAFLDPFGIRGLDARTYQAILSAPASEIFLLVAHAGSARLNGAIHAGDRRYADVSERILAQGTLFDGQIVTDLEHAASVRAEAQTRAQATAAASREIFHKALGPKHAQRVENLSLADLATKFVHVMEDVLREAGATFITHFRVRDHSGTEKHVLMHATSSPVGVVAMKEIISSALNNPDLPEALRERLRLDLRVDVTAVLDAAARIHAGKTLPWARDAEGSLQSELLVLTPLFPFQAEEAKSELKRRDWFVNRDPATKKQMVAFPSKSR